MWKLGGLLRRRRPARSGQSLETTLDQLLPRESSRVAVLAAPGDDLAGLVTRVRPAASVVSYNVRGAVLDRHAALTAGGPWDAVIDAGPSRRQLRRVLASYYHLRPGGVLVLRDPAGAVAQLVDGRRDPSPVDSPDEPADVTRLVDSLAGRGRVGSHGYLVRGGAPVWAKLDESGGSRVLELRPEIGRVLWVIPGETFTRRCELRENDPDRKLAEQHQISAPAVALREYHEVTVAQRQLVIREQLLLPDTFRHNHKRRFTHKRLEDVAWLFARPRGSLETTTRLDGTYYHLDNEARGHFGHLLTEQVSRLWGWADAKREHPDLKAVMLIRRGRELRTWEYDLLAAGGISRDDIVFLRSPAQVEHLVSAAPLFSNPAYVHPRIAATWDEVGDNLAARATLTDLPRRIFVGRRTEKRPCRNATAVEDRFMASGFAVVYPEEYALADQVALFRGAQAIAGYAGSGMFTMCFVKDPTPVITVGSRRYSPRNEYLIAAVRGHPLTMITSLPVDPTDLHSPYEFDFAREGHFLDETLTALAP